MDESEHLMQVVRIYPSGAEEWLCPTCGRRFVTHGLGDCAALALDRGEGYVIMWGDTLGPSVAMKVVLVVGDEHVVHSGYKDIREIAPSVAALYEEAEMAERLLAWADLLKDVDFGDWEDGNIV